MSLTSVIRYARALDTGATDGSGKTALAFGDITAKYLTQGGTLTALTTETITTLGTYQAPTDAIHIRIKELSNSDPCKGVYEVHFHNTQMAESGKKLWLFLSATGAAFQPLELELVDRLPTSSYTAPDNASSAAAASSAASAATSAASAATSAAAAATDTTNIKTRLPGALVAGRIDSSVGAMAANVLTTTAIADDAITDAKIAVPAETAGRPTRVLAMLRRAWEWTTNKRIRSRATGAVQLRNAADSADLETQTQSTTGSTGSEVDTQTKGA